MSPRVVENASVRVIGRTGGHELEQSIFSFLPSELRDYVEKQGPPEKVVHEPSFREPMMIRVPDPHGRCVGKRPVTTHRHLYRTVAPQRSFVAHGSSPPAPAHHAEALA